MGSHAHKTLDANDARLTPLEGGGKLVGIGFGVGIVGLGGAAAVGATQGDHFSHFLHSYLTAFVYFLAIALGALFFVTLQHLTRAGWSVVVRRLAEIVAGTLPLMALLSLPILVPTVMGSHALYHWADPAIRAEDHLLHHKEPYLNNTFFLVRMVVFFGFWSLLARFWLSNSVKQDGSGDHKLTNKAEKISAPSMILFALTLTFGAVDLIMTLMPHWFSTIIGVYYFGSAMMTNMAVLILLSRYLQSKGKLTGIVTVEHYHDMGKLMFAFTFFWAYIAFSQYMLIWYANIPEGTFWYQPRQQGAWIGFSVLLLVGHFIIPFVGQMSRHAKRRLGILTFWAVWLLVAHWVDMYYLVAPTLIAEHGAPEGSLNLSLTDPLCWVGMLGFFVGGIALGLKKHRLVPVKDPRLGESLAFENY